MTRAERDQLILEARPVVTRTLIYYANRYPVHVREDAIQDGLATLMWSADHYDPAANASFLSYAIRRAAGAMIDGLRNQDHLTRGERQEYTRRANQAAADGCDLPSDNAPYSLSFAMNQRGEDEMPLEEHLTDTAAATPCDTAIRHERAAHVHAEIRGLPAREAFIIHRSYFEDMTLSRIAGELGITESRVSQLRTQALRRMRIRLQRQGLAA